MVKGLEIVGTTTLSMLMSSQLSANRTKVACSSSRLIIQHSTPPDAAR